MSFDPENPTLNDPLLEKYLTPPAPRKRGAPKGNQNAVTHGWYSRQLRPHPNAPLPPSGASRFPDEEIEALRRLVQNYSQAALQAQTFEELFEIARLFNRILGRLVPLVRQRRD